MATVPRAADERPPDRRQRKSRAALRRALLELVALKPYDTITVDDVAEVADVGRATFYAHYRDKADLLREISEELIGEAAQRATTPPDPTAPSGTYSGKAAADVIRHAGEHPDLYRLIISGAGGPAPRQQLISTLETAVTGVFRRPPERLGRTPRIPPSVTSAAYTGALLAIIEAWLGGELQGTPEEIAAVFMHGHVEGLRWAMGLNEGELNFAPPGDPSRTADPRRSAGPRASSTTRRRSHPPRHR